MKERNRFKQGTVKELCVGMERTLENSVNCYGKNISKNVCTRDIPWKTVMILVISYNNRLNLTKLG